MLNTYTKGMSAEYSVIVDALDNGLVPEVPVVPTTVHDMTIAGLRFQVKMGESNNKRLTADIRRPSARCQEYSPKDVDVFAVVDPVSKQIAYIKISEIFNLKHRLTFFFGRGYTRAGLHSGYSVRYFDDYTNILRVFASADVA